MTAQAGSGWRVTNQAQVTDLDDSGRFVDGIRVYFTTGRGHAGNVFVPLGSATPENVYAAISDRAQVMDGIADLASDSGA